MCLMLKKSNRLNLSIPQNLAILEKGQSKFLSSIFFQSFSRENEDHLRITVVIPKKAVPEAVLRNFYRRQIYLMIEEILSNKNDNFLQIKKDLVIILKKKVKLSQDKKENLDNFRKDIQILINKIF